MRCLGNFTCLTWGWSFVFVKHKASASERNKSRRSRVVTQIETQSPTSKVFYPVFAGAKMQTQQSWPDSRPLLFPEHFNDPSSESYAKRASWCMEHNLHTTSATSMTFWQQSGFKIFSFHWIFGMRKLHDIRASNWIKHSNAWFMSQCHSGTKNYSCMIIGISFIFPFQLILQPAALHLHIITNNTRRSVQSS